MYATVVSRPRSVLLVCALLAFSSSVAATPQVSVPGRQMIPPQPKTEGTLSPTLRRPVPLPAGPDMQQLAFGHAFGNDEPLLCVRSTNQLVTLRDPWVFDAPHLEGQPATLQSMAFQRTGVLGGFDLFLFSNGRGLRELPGDASWNFDPSSPLAAGLWAGAVELQVVNEGGVDFAAALTADRMTVISLRDDPVLGWTSGFQVSVGQVVLDVAYPDSDGDGTKEIAVLTATEVAWYEQNGTFLGSFSSSGGGVGALEVVRDGGVDLLAWATLNGGDPTLFMIGPGAADDPLTLSFPIVEGQVAQDLDLAAMTAGDVDGDGRDDLVFTDFASHRAVLMLHQVGTAVRFSKAGVGGDHFLLHLSSSPGQSGAQNDCAPIVADVDNDGKNDVVFGLDSTGELVFFTKIPEPSETEGVLAASSTPVAAATTYHNETKCEPPGGVGCTDGELNIAFLLTQALADQWDYVQVTHWLEPGQGISLDAESVSNQLFPFYGTAPGRSIYQWVKVDVAEPWVVWPGMQHYHGRFRFVRADVTGPEPVILEASPSATLAFTLRHTGSYGQSITLDDFPYLLSIATTGIGFLMFDIPTPLPSGSEARPSQGGPGTARRLPGVQSPAVGLSNGTFDPWRWLLGGNNYIGALYIDTKAPSPEQSHPMHTGPLLLISNPQNPW